MTITAPMPNPNAPLKQRKSSGVITTCHLVVLVLGTSLSIPSSAAILNLMPVPASVVQGEGRLDLPSDTVPISLSGPASQRIIPGVSRALRRWEERTGVTFARTPEGAYAFVPAGSTAKVTIAFETASAPLPQLGDDESYSLTIDSQQARLRAATDVGILRGLETLLQLLQVDSKGWSLPTVTIQDRPRFPWRGLMIDVARHWQPMEVVKRNLDGMALVKLNVLHLHLSEDQGFRIESKTHPELQRRGSDGHYFTQDEIREIISYAADRGIRVVPEFDIPGHATSWVVSHPELASAPGPYVIERKWGVCDPVLDPTNEAVYALLNDVLGEMAALFPDPYFHIGGDENNGKQWSANAHIQAFIQEHGLKNNAGLHAYFNRRVRDILAPHGKKLVGWDEILHPDLPKDAIIHSWRGPEGLADAATQGFSTILSNGYYIDLCFPASDHYLNDPLPAGTPLNAEQAARVLGGEATMWSEWVTPETIDSRIWPRTAAIAERLWSPREVNDVPSMYRRLAVVSQRLEEAGLQHERNRLPMIRRLAGDGASAADIQNLVTFIDALEPVKRYERNHQQPNFRQYTPLNTFADCARPESDSAREFAVQEKLFLAFAAKGSALTPEEKKQQFFAFTAMKRQLEAWREAGIGTAYFFGHRPEAGGGGRLARALTDITEAGLTALAALQSGAPRPEEDWRARQLAALERASEKSDAVELPAIASIRRLVAAVPQ